MALCEPSTKESPPLVVVHLSPPPHFRRFWNAVLVPGRPLVAVDGNWNARDPCQLKDAVGINSPHVLLIFLPFFLRLNLFLRLKRGTGEKVCLDGSVTREVFYFYLVFLWLFNCVSSYLSMTCQWIFHHLYINFLHNRRTYSPFSFPSAELFRSSPTTVAITPGPFSPLRLRFPFHGPTLVVKTLDDGRFLSHLTLNLIDMMSRDWREMVDSKPLLLPSTHVPCRSTTLLTAVLILIGR